MARVGDQQRGRAVRGLIELTDQASAEHDRLEERAREEINNAIADAVATGASWRLASAAAIIREVAPALSADLTRATRAIEDSPRVHDIRARQAQQAGPAIRAARKLLAEVSLPTESARDALRVVHALLLGLQDEADEVACHCTCSDNCVEPRKRHWDLAVWRDRVPNVSRALRDGGVVDRAEVALLVAEIAKDLYDGPSRALLVAAAEGILDALPTILCDADAARFAKLQSKAGVEMLADWLARVSPTGKRGKYTPPRIAAKLLLAAEACGVRSARDDEQDLTSSIAKAIERRGANSGSDCSTSDVR